MIGQSQSASYGTLDQHFANLPLVTPFDPNGNPDDWGKLIPGAFSGIDLRKPAGPVSERFIQATNPFALLNGPVGSAKTTTLAKKGVNETRRMPPWYGGHRRYMVTFWREKYDSLWTSFLPSWWKIFPRNFPGSTWQGANMRPAIHTIRFRDEWTDRGGGDCILEAHFRAYGDAMEAGDLKGGETTDVAIDEWDQSSPDLHVWLQRAVGRVPPAGTIGRLGRFYGACNAPDPDNFIYEMFWETDDPETFALYRQPGGMEPGAENIEIVGRAYYENIIRTSKKKRWYVDKMVHNIPCAAEDGDLVYDEWDNARMASPVEMEFEPLLPVLVGIDGGLQPAAVYEQEMPDGQMRTLKEIWLDRGDEYDLAEAMQVMEARHFPKAHFETICDPAMCAGEKDKKVAQVHGGSMRQRLEKKLGRPVTPCHTNDVAERHSFVQAKLRLTLSEGRPGVLVNPSCKMILRGFNGGYVWHRDKSSGQRRRVKDGDTTHVHDGKQYAGSISGTARANMAIADRKRRNRRRQQAGRDRPRADPFAPRHGRGQRRQGTRP